MAVGASCPWIIAYVPRVAVATVPVYVGLEILQEWLVDSYLKIARAEWKVLVAVGTTVVCVDLPTAVLVGLVLSLFICAREYNSVTGIVSEDCLGKTCSHVERSEEEQQVLLLRGGCVHVFWLEGYLFFGSASLVIKQIQQRLQSFRDEIAYVVIDFSRVPAVDASGVSALVDMVGVLQVQVIFAGMVRRLYNAVRGEHDHEPGKKQRLLTFRTLDSALEHVEEKILKEEAMAAVRSAINDGQFSGNSGLPDDMKAKLCAIVGSEDLAGCLLAEGEVLEGLKKDHLLWSEGDDVEQIVLLLSGALVATAGLPQAHLPKPMDERHLNRAKGDEYVETRHMFKRSKWKQPSAIGFFEVAAGMRSHLATVKVDQSNTSVLLVPSQYIEKLRSDSGSPGLQAALNVLISSALVKWAMNENGKVRELVARSQMTLGDRGYESEFVDCQHWN